MPQELPTRRERRIRILSWVALVGFIVAVIGTLLDGRLLEVFALAALASVVFAQATGLVEPSAVVRLLTGVLATAGLVLAAVVFYTGLVS